MEQEISLLDLWNLFRKYFVRIAGMTIIGAALAVAFMLLFVDRKYESEAQLLVNQSSGQETAMQYSELQSNVYLINTYTDIIQGDAVLTAVNESLGNHFTIGELRGAISVTQSQNSQAFYISATMESPVDAQNIVNSIITEFENTLMELYGDDVTGIYVMSSASYNPNAVSPSIIIYALIGGMLGFIIMAGIVLIKELMDTRVKSVDDLTNMGLIRLGEINELTNTQVKKNRYRIESDNTPLRRRV
ncbi:LPS chain length-determining protein [Aerococcaceae bacterium INB8]|uniref:Capsular polysaccharide biosynthesis protein CpsC n=1 Tax=Ruoffia halotolerans TaxID=2748684 RepID=A0A839A7J5_9LACT|nr:Wzz/FepE/Etk N-terminal domain-containing protein [Ruoffia halotolerans]MBA5730047.1 LPS chain length-determining protein [Ruoffia halotolerans]